MPDRPARLTGLPEREGEVDIGGRRVRLTSLDRLLWPGEAFHKRDLVRYYERVAPAILPHIAGRPLSMVRMPGGVASRIFLQNECRGAPEWMHTAPLRLQTGAVRHYCLVDDLPSLVWVANQGTIELHPYPALAARPDVPVVLLLDLDPGPGTTTADACRVALLLRGLAEERGLAPVPKTSGGAGIHLYAPLRDAAGFDASRALGRDLAAAAFERMRDLVAPPDARARKPGRVLVDWLQNDPRRSTIAPYSLRAGPSLTVSTPLMWDEVEAGHGLVFGPEDVLRRLDAHGDLFASAIPET